MAALILVRALHVLPTTLERGQIPSDPWTAAAQALLQSANGSVRCSTDTGPPGPKLR